MKHDRHPAGHVDGCRIDFDPAWVQPLCSKQIPADWVDRGSSTCPEPSEIFLVRLQYAVVLGNLP